MSFAEIEPAKDPRSFEQKNPVKEVLQKNYEKRNPRSPRSPEAHDKVSDLYKKAKEEHSAKTEEEFQSMRGHDEEEHYGGGGADIDLGGSGTESETMAYSKFYAGPHSMFQVRKEQPQAMPREED